MTARTDPFALAPEVMSSLMALSGLVESGSIERIVLELVKIRVSQINGCANCLNMHTSDARKAGETDQRLHLVAAWRDAPVFSARERAALAWAEALTRPFDQHGREQALPGLADQYDAREQVQLTLAIMVINGWNRLALGCGMFDEALGW